MADITRLPTEILRMIWSLLSPKDMASLSSTCQIIRRAGQPHVDRLKRYSIIGNTAKREDNLGSFERNSDRRFPPPRFVLIVDGISKDPLATEYVHEFQIDFHSESWATGSSRREFWARAFGDAFATIMRRFPYLEFEDGAGALTEKAQTCKKDIEDGNDDIVAVLLLSLLPEVRTLRFRCVRLIPSICIFVIERIACDPTTTALSHLTTVEVDFNQSLYTSGDALNMLAACAALPSLKTLRGSNIGHETYFRSRNLSTAISNVTELALRKFSTDSDSLSTFLSMFQSLSNFTYESLGPRDSTLWPLDPKDLIFVLQRCAENSLRHLTMYSGEDDGPWMGSLAAFSKLAYVHTDWQLLVDERNPSNYQLVRKLPRSLQQLYLRVEPDFDVEARSNLIKSLVFAKPISFPVLTNLVLSGISRANSRALLGKRFITTAKEAGLIIECEVPTDQDLAVLERSKMNIEDFPTLTEHLARLALESTG
ncbi:MAG: hypothetical protein HETSPECPRED_005827 [Heterodermia speciosa]|uniref:F-box domain-containing protein n=1 Tax=Heterodermia speciosa TaxID=116794 RepID=A0A8H3ILL5_9LECA|nr:MAG: hypothetical protein HETSPECPRED_005827 [Heterodermia speciosa]